MTRRLRTDGRCASARFTVYSLGAWHFAVWGRAAGSVKRASAVGEGQCNFKAWEFINVHERHTERLNEVELFVIWTRRFRFRCSEVRPTLTSTSGLRQLDAGL
jgi:hypothetical protein